MKIVEHGTRGDHWGKGDYDLVIHKGRGQLQLSEGEAYELCKLVIDYLDESENNK